MSRSAGVTRRSVAHRVPAGAALLAVVLMGGMATARPKDLNVALDRSSDRGVFRVRVQSQVAPIPLSRVHPWTVRLTDQAGLPISGAVIDVDGGMPEHHHGLPTAPRASSAATPGDYLISGMKFSMTGWWVLKLAIRAPDGRTDRVTFNLIL